MWWYIMLQPCEHNNGIFFQALMAVMGVYGHRCVFDRRRFAFLRGNRLVILPFDMPKFLVFCTLRRKKLRPLQKADLKKSSVFAERSGNPIDP